MQIHKFYTMLVLKQWILVTFIEIRILSLFIPIGRRQITLVDSSKSINIKSISTAATVYLMSTLFKIARFIVYTVCFTGKLESIMLITLIE